MKRIIALRGKGNSGKTTTIWMLRDILKEDSYVPAPNMFEAGKDFSDVLEKNHIRIGITTAGDSFDLVQKRFRSLIEKSCQIFFYACRSFDRNNEGTNAVVNSFTPPYVVDYVEKTIESDPLLREVTNELDSRRLAEIAGRMVS